MNKTTEEALSRLSGNDSDKNSIIRYINLLERENRALADDNEVKCDAIAELKRKIYGLETTVRHCKEKEEKMYRNYYWPHEE